MNIVQLISISFLLNFMFTSHDVHGQSRDSLLSVYHYQSGKEWLDKGDLARALPFIRRSVRFDSLNMIANQTLVNILYLTEEYNEMEAIALKALIYYDLGIVPKDISYKWINFKYALLLYDLGEYDKVIFYINQALEFDEVCLECYNVRGFTYLTQKSYSKSFDDHLKAYELGLKDKNTYRGLFASLFHLERYDDAVHYYKAMDKDSISHELYGLIGTNLVCAKEYNLGVEYLLNYLMQNSHLDQTQLFDTYYYIGYAYNGIGDYAKARQYFEYYFKSELIDASVYPNYLETLIQLGEIALAKRRLDEYKKRIPDDGGWDYYYGCIAFKEKNMHIAEEYFNLAFEKGTVLSNIEDFYKNLAHAFTQVNNLNKVILCMEQYVIDGNNSSDEWELLKLYSYDLDTYDVKFNQRLTKLRHLYGNQPEELAFVYAFEASVLYNAQRFNDALEKINKAIQLDPHSEYYVFRAFIRFYQKVLEIELGKLIQSDFYDTSYNEIIHDFEFALEMNHRKADVFLAQASFFIMLEDNSKTCSSIKYAIKFGATVKEAYLNYFCEGVQLPEAEKPWHFVFSLSPFHERFR